jgi:magnesium chelatase family protein
MAHRGVLFLDELPEFTRPALEGLRMPLQDGEVVISRSAGSVRLPARCLLVAAMNPCPCGYLGDTLRTCRCTPQQIARYRDRLSGPLRDRIDLIVEVPALPVAALTATVGNGLQTVPNHGESSALVRDRVVAARDRQLARFSSDGIRTNTELTPSLMTRDCALDARAARLLDAAAVKMSLSARGYDRVRKVARTIADLAGADAIAADHLAEALQFRMVDEAR